jgi:hypothetical protein
MEELLSLVSRLSVASTPQGVSIEVDGETIGRTPLAERLILKPGSHELRATLADHEPIVRTVKLAPGELFELELNMQAVAVDDASTAIDPLDENRSIDTAASESRPGRLMVSAGFGTNTLDIANTGAPTLGVSYDLGRWISVGVDAIFVAYALMPQLQLHLVDGSFRVSAVASVVASSSGGDDPEAFVAGAAGLRTLLPLNDRVWVHASLLASYAAGDYGWSIPAFAGAGLRF